VEANLAVNSKLSVPVSGTYFSYSSGDDDASIMGIGGGIRYYWQGNAVNGWCVGANLNLLMTKVESTLEVYGGSTITEYTGSHSASVVSYGALIGYQSIWSNGVSLDTGLGFSMLNIPSVDYDLKSDDGSIVSYSFDGISATLPSIKLAVGYAF